MTAEGRRHDLYTGLTELLGEDRAATLMAYLPHRQYDELATRADVEATRFDLEQRIDNLDSDMIIRFDTLNSRIDGIVLTLAAGLIAIIATLIVQGF